MTQHLRRAGILCFGWLLVSATLALGADRPASEILKDLENVKSPALDRTKVRDRDYVQSYLKERQEAAEKRSKLILELFKADPENERIPELMAERWGNTQPVGNGLDALLKEIDDVLAHSKNAKLKVEATFMKAQVALFQFRQQGEGKLDLSSIRSFTQLAPKDPRGAQLLYMAAVTTNDAKTKGELEDQILKDYADSRFVPMIQGSRRQKEGIGKPFELEFTDATNGSTISMSNLKGKVVVVDFWATWCGPCVAEMPNMKKLYDKYHGQGVEFLGISLDQPKEQGGLDALKKYVKENEIRWPQYYQGKGWESDFSRKWGINAIPCMFLVDQQGKLVSVEARGKLEELIPDLLAKKSEKAPAGGE